MHCAGRFGEQDQVFFGRRSTASEVLTPFAGSLWSESPDFVVLLGTRDLNSQSFPCHFDRSLNKKAAQKKRVPVNAVLEKYNEP